jgi:hypothetical protein
MKRYLVPVIAGVTVFGAVTAFAATLNVTSNTLGAGTKDVQSCNAGATVGYQAGTYSATAPAGYRVTTVSVTTGQILCASKSFRVTISDSSNVSLAEASGTLDASGNATNVAVAPLTAPAVNVANVSVVITS